MFYCLTTGAISATGELIEHGSLFNMKTGFQRAILRTPEKVAISVTLF